MTTIIKGKNLHVSDQTEAYVEKRVEKFHRFLPDIKEIRVDLSQEKTKSQADRFVAQITVRANRRILRAEERNSNLHAAFDNSLDKMHSQIARIKGKKLNRWHAPESIRDEDFPPISEEVFQALAEENERQVVRVKQFPITPMSQEEAIEQMELLSHSFFVFFNADAGRINVLYRRDDSNYGIIDPVIG